MNIILTLTVVALGAMGAADLHLELFESSQYASLDGLPNPFTQRQAHGIVGYLNNALTVELHFHNTNTANNLGRKLSWHVLDLPSGGYVLTADMDFDPPYRQVYLAAGAAGNLYCLYESRDSWGFWQILNELRRNEDYQKLVDLISNAEADFRRHGPIPSAIPAAVYDEIWGAPSRALPNPLGDIGRAGQGSTDYGNSQGAQSDIGESDWGNGTSIANATQLQAVAPIPTATADVPIVQPEHVQEVPNAANTPGCSFNAGPNGVTCQVTCTTM